MKNFCEDLFFFFFWRALALVSLVLGLGLEHSCPWPRECLSSERLSLALALASDFFFVSLALALASSLVSSTPPLVKTKFDDYFAIRKNVIYERAVFNKRFQLPNEPVEDFILALHCLVEHCNFGALKEKMIRDR